MKKLMYIFLALPILTGCKEKKSTGAMGGMPTPEISVTKPIVEDITLTKDYPGYLTTEKTVNLVARVNGTLQSTSYVAGGRVKQGQLLFVIEPTLYKDQVEQAEAELKTAQAQLEYARNNYSRMKEAVKSDAVSQIQVLQAESSVKEGVAAVSNAEAALSTARTNLGYCYVRAPFDGTISKAVLYYSKYKHFDDKYPDANMIVQMLLLGFKIEEVPAVMHPRNNGVSMHHGLKPIMYMFRMVFSILAVTFRIKVLKVDAGAGMQDVFEKE